MKIAVIVVSAFMVLLASGCAVGGAVFAVAFGTDNRIETSEHRFDSATYALISDTADLTDEGPGGNDFNDRVEDIRIRIAAAPRAAGEEVFLGVGRTADVDAYLAGVPHDIVTDVEFGDFALTKTPVSGTGEPERPGEQDFWLETATGPGRQTLDWGVLTVGEYRFVIMNADASQGVDVDATLGAKIPYAFTVGLALAIIGAVFIVIGIIAIMLAARSGGGTPKTASPA